MLLDRILHKVTTTLLKVWASLLYKADSYWLARYIDLLTSYVSLYNTSMKVSIPHPTPAPAPTNQLPS